MPFNLDLHGKNTFVSKQAAREGVVQVSGGSGANQKRFGTASKKRILATHWFGEAWKQLLEKPDALRRAFEKGGCSQVMGLDTSKIDIPGFHGNITVDMDEAWTDKDYVAEYFSRYPAFKFSSKLLDEKDESEDSSAEESSSAASESTSSTSTD